MCLLLSVRAQVLAATPFSDESHTGEAIARKTAEALERVSVKGPPMEQVFNAVSDNAANMLLGFANFGSVGCAVHTIQLCVNSFLECSDVEPLRLKQKGIVRHFHKSTGLDGLNGLFSCMRQSGMPVHHPVRACETRWSSDYKQMEWFRYEQLAVQRYDTVHSTRAGWAYKEFQLDLDDWQLNEQCCAVLAPFADWTQHMQGTKGYPTLPLMLPTIFALIQQVLPSSDLVCSFPEKADYVLHPTARPAMSPGLNSARHVLHDEVKRRFITGLDPEVKKLYYIATLLHPCFKDVDFSTEYSFVPVTDRTWALAELKKEWRFNWAPAPMPQATVTPAEPATPAPLQAAAAPEGRFPLVPIAEIKASKKVSLSGLLGKRPVATTARPEVVALQLDELDEYLKAPREDDTDLPVLQWWACRAGRWPNLAKMVRQYFALPCSSAGVERVFSAAGKMHDDLRKSVKDETLEASLLAAFNHDDEN